ncbi:MAG: hydrolase [Myxococcota bacterium]
MLLDQDMHVYSTFSDGRHVPEEVIASARDRGVRRLCFGDRVGRDTGWLPRYVEHLEKLRARCDLEIVIGVESRILDEDGALDLPADLDGVERISVADHRLPVGGHLLGPRQLRERLADGRLVARQVIDALLGAYEACVHRYRDLQIAHPLRLLSVLEIPEWQVPLVQLRRLALMFAHTGTLVEISERWRCPSPRIARLLRQEGVTVVASSDAHDARDVGRYRYVRSIGWRLP